MKFKRTTSIMRVLPFCRTGMATLLLAASCWANPAGGDVTAGQAAIQQANGQMTITQSTDRAIIQWQSFSIGSGESVRFIQPGALSAILNRVVGVDPSVILGALQANGQVFLINPNGVVFGPGSQVDVAGLVVSTLNLSDQDFLAGTIDLTQDANQALRSVINQGTIRIQDNGMLVLAAPVLSNEGLIVANQGRVALAAGESASVSFDPNDLIQFQVSTPQTSSGRVLLDQSAVSEVLRGVVSNPAVSPATELVMVNGEWELVNGSGLAVQAGTIVADAAGGEAGKVRVDSTRATVLTENSLVSAAGHGANSDGGEIYLLSQGQTAALPGARADISAGSSGNGGFAELSGSSILTGLQVDAEVANGNKGTYLIDPAVLTIADGPMPAVPAADTVYEESIESSAAFVILSADETVNIEDITDDEITLMPGIDLLIATSFGTGEGVFFEDSFDAFVTSGAGTIQVDSASDISPGTFVSESSVTLLAGGNVGYEDEGVFVESPSLSLSVDGDATLNTLVDTLSGTTGGDLTVESFDSIHLSGVSAGSRLSVTAFGDITGSGSAMDNSLLFATDGTIGSEATPFSISVDGDLLVAASNEVGGRSVTLTGTVVDGAQVVDTTPGESLLNGSQIPEISLIEAGGLLENFDEFDVVDLGFEFGLGDDEIEDLEAQLGLLGDDLMFDEDFFHGDDFLPEPGGPGEPGEPGKPGEKKKEGESGAKGDRRSQLRGGPIIAQAGFRPGPQATAALMKVRIEQLPQVQVQVLSSRPSPFEMALTSPQLRADDVLDLSALDLSNFEVKLSYDIMGDPVLINPKLRAGDLFELQVGELSEVPVEISE